MLNHISIQGRCVADPELRTTTSGTEVATVTVAVERDYSGDSNKREVDFISVVAWKHNALFLSRYFHKGSMIVVSGRLQSRKWQDRDGNNRTSWEVNADSVYFGESRRDNQQSYQQNAYQQRGQVNVDPPQSFDGFQEMGPGTGAGNPFTGANGAYQQAGMWDNGDGELPFD